MVAAAAAAAVPTKRCPSWWLATNDLMKSMRMRMTRRRSRIRCPNLHPIHFPLSAVRSLLGALASQVAAEGLPPKNREIPIRFLTIAHHRRRPSHLERSRRSMWSAPALSRRKE